MSEGQRTEGRNLGSKADTIIITGIAKLSENAGEEDFSSYVAVEFEIDPDDSIVVNAHCTSLMPTDMLQKACLGNRIEVGIVKTIEELERRFFSSTKTSLIAALENAYEWYKRSRSTNR